MAEKQINANIKNAELLTGPKSAGKAIVSGNRAKHIHVEHRARQSSEANIIGVLNARQEIFAQLVAEGRDYANAYTEAGYCPSTSSASQLANKPQVAMRVRELQARALKRHDVNIDELAAELEKARQVALASRQPAAAVSATMAKAKLYNLVGDAKRGGPHVDTKTTSLGNRELARQLAFLLT